MMTKTQINKLKKMMNDLDYPFEAPLKESFIESIIQIGFNSNSTNCLEKLCNEVSILFNNQPDYLNFLRAMDGFEVNGLRLFSLSIPEPSVKNLFTVNEFYRNNDDFIKLSSLAEGLPIDVRFIEMMPIGEGGKYRSVSGEAILEELKEKYKKVYPAEENMGNGPAVYYGIRGFKGKIGFINAVHGQFCSQCNRIRLTSTGFLKTCLCYDDGVSLREAVRAKRLDEVKRLMEEAVKNKPAAHCFSQRKGITEERDMSEIGG